MPGKRVYYDERGRAVGTPPRRERVKRPDGSTWIKYNPTPWDKIKDPIIGDDESIKRSIEVGAEDLARRAKDALKRLRGESAMPGRKPAAKKPAVKKPAAKPYNEKTGFTQHLGVSPTKRLQGIQARYKDGTLPRHQAQPQAIRAAGDEARMDLEMLGANRRAGTPPPKKGKRARH